MSTPPLETLIKFTMSVRTLTYNTPSYIDQYMQIDYKTNSGTEVVYSGDITGYRGTLFTKSETYGGLEVNNVEINLKFWNYNTITRKATQSTDLPPDQNFQPFLMHAIWSAWEAGDLTKTVDTLLEGTSSSKASIVLRTVVEFNPNQPINDQDDDTLMTIERIGQQTAQEKIQEIEAGIERNLMESFQIEGVPLEEVLLHAGIQPPAADVGYAARLGQYAARLGESALEVVPPTAILDAAEYTIPVAGMAAAAYGLYKMAPVLVDDYNDLQEERARSARFEQMRTDTLARGKDRQQAHQQVADAYQRDIQKLQRLGIDIPELQREAQGISDGPVYLDPVGPNPEEVSQIDTSAPSWWSVLDNKLRFPSAKGFTLNKNDLFKAAENIAEGYAKANNIPITDELIYSVFAESLDEDDRAHYDESVANVAKTWPKNSSSFYGHVYYDVYGSKYQQKSGIPDFWNYPSNSRFTFDRIGDYLTGVDTTLKHPERDVAINPLFFHNLLKKGITPVPSTLKSIASIMKSNADTVLLGNIAEQALLTNDPKHIQAVYQAVFDYIRSPATDPDMANILALNLLRQDQPIDDAITVTPSMIPYGTIAETIMNYLPHMLLGAATGYMTTNPFVRTGVSLLGQYALQPFTGTISNFVDDFFPVPNYGNNRAAVLHNAAREITNALRHTKEGWHTILSQPALVGEAVNPFLTDLQLWNQRQLDILRSDLLKAQVYPETRMILNYQNALMLQAPERYKALFESGMLSTDQLKKFLRGSWNDEQVTRVLTHLRAMPISELKKIDFDDRLANQIHRFPRIDSVRDRQLAGQRAVADIKTYGIPVVAPNTATVAEGMRQLGDGMWIGRYHLPAAHPVDPYIPVLHSNQAAIEYGNDVINGAAGYMANQANAVQGYSQYLPSGKTALALAAALGTAYGLYNYMSPSKAEETAASLADAIETQVEAKRGDTYTVDNVLVHPENPNKRDEAHVDSASKIFQDMAKHLQRKVNRTSKSRLVYPTTSQPIYHAGRSVLGKRRGPLLHSLLEEATFLKEKSERLKRLKYSY